MSEPWFRRGPTFLIFSNYWPLGDYGWLCFIGFTLAFGGWWIFSDSSGFTDRQPGLSALIGFGIAIGWQFVAWLKSERS